MRFSSLARSAAIGAVLAGIPVIMSAQDRLKTMPGYAQFEKMAPLYQGAVKSGSVLAPAGFPGRGGRGGGGTGITWTADGKAVEYSWDGKHFSFDLASHKT